MEFKFDPDDFDKFSEATLKKWTDGESQKRRTFKAQEDQEAEDKEFVKRYTHRDWKWDSNKKMLRCAVEEFPELLAYAASEAHVNYAIDEELIRCRNTRLLKGMAVPEPRRDEGPSR